MRISVVIPVYNGGSVFNRCLEALWQSSYGDWECIVVDDGSVDDSAMIAERFGAIVVHSERPQSGRPQSGPALARNLGVQSAGGEILFFIDSDVLVKPETLAVVAELMGREDAPTACIGSYDDRPMQTNFLSQYRNLLHHFTHQSANREAATFWSGCGIIRRSVFLELGGFNSDYSRPSIEDIELGYRLRAKGIGIILEKDLQVGHMKRWTAVHMLVTDIRDRAIPWARLILTEGSILNDLNVSMNQRVSSAVSILGAAALISAFFYPGIGVAVFLTAVLLIHLNQDFYRFLTARRGIGFACLAMPWHWLYFIYSGLSFGICFLEHLITTVQRRLES